MPFANFHAARVKDPDAFVRIRMLKELPNGIQIYGGPLKSDPSGDTKPQTYRFPKSKFSVSQAKAWLKEHDIKTTGFEKATGDHSDDQGRVARFDRGLIQRMYETPDGFLKGDGYVTKTGVFTYVNPDGTLRKELRHPSDVLTLESMESMKMIPLTNGHPDRLVTPETAKQLQVGHLGENIRPDGELILAPVMITDGGAIQAVMAGRQNLSLGYEVDLVEEAGEYEGQRYDFRQTNIRYNHLALVDSARAGNRARLKLDSADAVMAEDRQDDRGRSQPTPTHKERRMSIYTIDGIDYEAAPEVVNHVKALQKRATGAEQRADKAEGERDSAKADLEKVTGERDDLKAKADKAEKEQPENVLKAVQARVSLIEKARKHLDEDAQEKLDEMTDKDIMEAVITAKYPDTKLDGKSDEYVQARFDAIAEDGEGDGDGGADKGGDRKDANASQRQSATPKVHGKGKGPNMDESFENMQKRQAEAWKSEPAK